MKLIHSLFVLTLVSGVTGAQAPHATSTVRKPATPTGQLANKGTVVTVIDVPSYTYIEVKQANKPSVWLAAPTVKVKKGDVIRYDVQMEMTDFKSSTLKRTFKSILFVGKVVVTTEKA